MKGEENGRKFFYHVISDIPKKVGEHIILDEKHPNGVHKRVYEELQNGFSLRVKNL